MGEREMVCERAEEHAVPGRTGGRVDQKGEGSIIHPSCAGYRSDTSIHFQLTSSLIAALIPLFSPFCALLREREQFSLSAVQSFAEVLSCMPRPTRGPSGTRSKRAEMVRLVHHVDEPLLEGLRRSRLTTWNTRRDHIGAP